VRSGATFLHKHEVTRGERNATTVLCMHNGGLNIDKLYDLVVMIEISICSATRGIYKVQKTKAK
jgi:hypothetical protein